MIYRLWCVSLSLCLLSFSQRFVPGQGLVLYPQIGDKMDIVCPRMEGGSTEGVEYYKLYMVPLEQLKSCQVTKADTPLLNCVKPDQDVKFTLKFQEFSPNLWGLEFFRGKTTTLSVSMTVDICKPPLPQRSGQLHLLGFVYVVLSIGKCWRCGVNYISNVLVSRGANNNTFIPHLLVFVYIGWNGC